MRPPSRRQVSAGPLEPALAGTAGLGARSRAGTWRSEIAGRRALHTMVAAGLAMVLVAAARPSPLVIPSKGGWPAWMVGPFQGLAGFLPDDHLVMNAAFTAALLAMAGAYLVVLACAEHLPLRPVAVAVAALHAVFLLGPPLPLTDVFNYIDYARLGAVHGLNPYVDAPATVPTDPAYAFSTWHHFVSVYGQLFTLASYGLALLGVPAAFWTLKALTAAASLGCVWLVWRLARRLGRPPLTAVVLVGLNPLLLAYGVGGAHNDFFMLLALLGAAVWLADGREARAGAAAVVAVGLKTSGVLLLPFMALGARRRRELLLGAGVAALALGALSLAAFGLHVPALHKQAELVTPLSAANLLGLALGQGGATELVQLGLQVALAGVLAWLLVRTWRGADWITTAGWATLALVLSLSWEMPWYAAWVLPFTALSASRALRRATLALCAFFVLSFAPLTSYVLADVCDCWPADTETGQRNDREIRQFLR